jgi:glycine/D-amino acid oxidase-like deaminating enzyme
MTMPAPLVRIETTASQPQVADVVVIGGGIVGVFAAHYLVRRGLKVVIVEKGLIGAEQSSRNWGWCRQQNRDARELPMATKSLDLWDQFAAESGEDTGFRRCGLLYLSNDDKELEAWARWRDFAQTVGVTTFMLSSTEATERGKATGKEWRGGVFSPSDGTADPSKAATAVARATMSAGGIILQNCAARGIETSGGRLSAVVTELGVIRTRIAVLAGGAWASSFCNNLDVRFPQAAVRSSILALAPGIEDLPDALHTAEVSATRRADGGYTLAISGRARVDVTPQQLRFARYFVPMFAKRWRNLAPGGLEGWRSAHESLTRWRLDECTPMERMRILDPAVDESTISDILRRARHLLPALAHARVSSKWAGYIDSTPDGVPAIGEVMQIPGFILAAGFSGHGFGIAPGAGHLIADLITGQTPLVDPAPYRPERLSGSNWGKVADF